MSINRLLQIAGLIVSMMLAGCARDECAARRADINAAYARQEITLAQREERIQALDEQYRLSNPGSQFDSEKIQQRRNQEAIEMGKTSYDVYEEEGSRQQTEENLRLRRK